MISSSRLYSTTDTTVQDMLFRIRDTNKKVDRSSSLLLLEFVVDGKKIGLVTPEMAQILMSAVYDSPFELRKETNTKNQQFLTLSDSIPASCEARTEAVGRVCQELRHQGVVSGWRDELYPISNNYYSSPLFLMERAAVPVIGAMEYGVHMNGLVLNNNHNNNSFEMWMARRSSKKSKYPNMLDHIVAGGQPHDISLSDNVIKECLEEAGIPEQLTRQCMRPAGAISYQHYSESKKVVSRAVLFCYDLYLPADFQPTPVDGEVDEFFLWSIDELKASMSPDFHDPIKPNCYPVIIDFLLRHGQIDPEAPGYLDVLRELRSGECY